MPTTTEQFIVNRKGRRTAVVMPWRRYRQIMEDLHDLAVVAERRREKPVPLADVEGRMRGLRP